MNYLSRSLVLYVMVLALVLGIGVTAYAASPAVTFDAPTPTWTATLVLPTANTVLTASGTLVPVTPNETPVSATLSPTLTVPEPTATGEISSTTVESTTGASANECLNCHEYDKILKMAPKFKLSDDSLVNPHWYVPHDSTNIPDCTSCHTPHSMSPLPKGPSDVDLSQTDVQYCFSCHHMQSFTPCKTCHP